MESRCQDSVKPTRLPGVGTFPEFTPGSWTLRPERDGGSSTTGTRYDDREGPWTGTYGPGV